MIAFCRTVTQTPFSSWSPARQRQFLNDYSLKCASELARAAIDKDRNEAVAEYPLSPETQYEQDREHERYFGLIDTLDPDLNRTITHYIVHTRRSRLKRMVKHIRDRQSTPLPTPPTPILTPPINVRAGFETPTASLATLIDECAWTYSHSNDLEQLCVIGMQDDPTRATGAYRQRVDYFRVVATERSVKCLYSSTCEHLVRSYMWLLDFANSTRSAVVWRQGSNTIVWKPTASAGPTPPRMSSIKAIADRLQKHNPAWDVPFAKRWKTSRTWIKDSCACGSARCRDLTSRLFSQTPYTQCHVKHIRIGKRKAPAPAGHRDSRGECKRIRQTYIDHRAVCLRALNISRTSDTKMNISPIHYHPQFLADHCVFKRGTAPPRVVSVEDAMTYGMVQLQHNQPRSDLVGGTAVTKVCIAVPNYNINLWDRQLPQRGQPADQLAFRAPPTITRPVITADTTTHNDSSPPLTATSRTLVQTPTAQHATDLRVLQRVCQTSPHLIGVSRVSMQSPTWFRNGRGNERMMSYYGFPGTYEQFLCMVTQVIC